MNNTVSVTVLSCDAVQAHMLSGRKMETVSFSEMLLPTDQSTRCHNIKGRHHPHCHLAALSKNCTMSQTWGTSSNINTAAMVGRKTFNEVFTRLNVT
jgi:hypothetical protein